jgi:hypothetical protein
MKESRLSLRRLNMANCAAAVFVSVCILAVDVQSISLRHGLLVANWSLWLCFVLVYPFAAISAGEVPGASAMSRPTSRGSSGFWVGLVATSAFWVAVLVCISLFSYMAWYPA